MKVNLQCKTCGVKEEKNNIGFFKWLKFMTSNYYCEKCCRWYHLKIDKAEKERYNDIIKKRDEFLQDYDKRCKK